jgi:hypothetical protein
MRTKVSASPFILDSGASIHISTNCVNFMNLMEIQPCTVRGISSYSISAIGIGKICLHISEGNSITLDPVLFVPQAAVCLVSVASLALSQKLATHFNDIGC